MALENVDYEDTISGLRKILFSQTRLIDAWLHKYQLHKSEQETIENIDDEVLKVVGTMIHMTGISAHSILNLTEYSNLQVRDCYPIARSIIESVINIAFILAEGRDAAKRADRHAQQKAYRDTQRSSKAGSWQINISQDIAIDPKYENQLKEMVAEFSTKSGRENRNWTDVNLHNRIDSINKSFGDKTSITIHTAMANIYRHASEVSHGTYFSAMHFWGLTQLGRPDPKTKEDLIHIINEHRFSILISVIFSLTTLIETSSIYVKSSDINKDMATLFKKLYSIPLIASTLEYQGKSID